MKKAYKIFAAILVILVLTGAWVWHAAISFLNTPPADPGKEILFNVPAGASSAKIVKDLYAKNLITDVNKFLCLIWLKDHSGKLQAGRFVLNSGWKPEKILDTLVNGKAMLHRVTIPEGLTWWQTAKILADAGFVRFDDFKEIISNPEFLARYGVPFATAEGFLMPDTYFLRKPDPEDLPEDQENRDKIWKDSAKAAAGRMIDNFWRKTQDLWPESVKSEGRPRPKKEDLKRAAILASIVEKETALDRERGRVAGVYANRLKQNMLLQADPTVIYGLGPDFQGSLTRAQLQEGKNPYNTYQKPGLPPGPISSFGIAALKAALNPEKHSYLYFVAVTDGGEHKFSRTLEEHNQAVEEYRRQKQKK